MIDKVLADKLYTSAIQNLYGAIRAFKIQVGSYLDVNERGETIDVPVVRESIKCFCETFNIDRPNLMKAFKKGTSKDLGVGTYIRCCKALGLKSFTREDITAIEAEPAIFNLSLRHYLMINNGAVKDSIFELEFD